MVSSIKSVLSYPTLLLFLFGLQFFETTYLSFVVVYRQLQDAFRGVWAIYWNFCSSEEKKTKSIQLLFTFSLASH